MGSKSRQRCQDWLNTVDPNDCKIICNGALVHSISPNRGAVDEDEASKEDAKVLHPDKTFYDGIYLRSYEPDYVRRVKGATSSFLQGHLELEPFNGNPE